MRNPIPSIAALLLTVSGTTAQTQTVRLDVRADSAAAEWRPQRQPTLAVRRAPGAIAIDGELDDAGWAGAAVATGFAEFEPREDARPLTPTEAWLTYDDRNLYVAFRVEDDPGALRVSLRDRDEVWNDDWVIIVFDPYGDNSWAYMIGANPIGVQLDARFSNNSGDDPSFDVVYRSAGQLTPTGWQVELAIPFASLRFPEAERQEWKLQFVRSHPRGARRQYAWSALSSDNACILCQSGTLTGIEGVEPGGQLELLPALVAGAGGALATDTDPGSFARADPSAALSLGVRYPFRSGWTAEASLNPDFSQIESDASQIDVNSTFALFFPERRPFFQEGSDLFETWVDVVYTRSINDPAAAGKVIGRQGDLAVGWIGAVDEHSPLIIPLAEESIVEENGRTVSNVLRARRMFGSGSFLGGVVTDRRFEGGGSGTSFGADAMLRFGERWQLEAQLVGSWTVEPDEAGPTTGYTETFGGHTAAFDGESFLGHASYVSLERSARGWNFDVDYWSASPTYRADNGFQGQNDFRRASLFNGYGFHFDDGLFDRIFVGQRTAQTWRFDGATRERLALAFVESQLEGQTYAGGEIVWNEESYGGTYFGDMVGWGAWIGSDFSEAVGFRLNYGRGDGIYRDEPQIGLRQSANASLTLKPRQNVVISPSVGWARMDGRGGERLFDGYIARTRLNYQFTRRLFVRVVTEWDDFDGRLSVEPLLLYRLNPLSVLYLGSTHGYRDFDEPWALERTSQQFFLKLQYLIRP